MDNISLDDLKEILDQEIYSERLFGKQLQKRNIYRLGKRFRWYNFRY
jgi:hypothetical protein